MHSDALFGPQKTDQSELAINRLPLATYRLQLRSDFGFEAIESLIGYLTELGISDLYLSPLFHARSESEHGYDVVDHSRVEPAFGGGTGFKDLALAAKQAGMGVILDIVPNHMGINDPDNHLWNDVLENGANARSAVFFDIDWQPPGCNFSGRILLPFLGKPFGEVLEAGEIKIERNVSGFVAKYFQRSFPLTPKSWSEILLAAAAILPENSHAEQRDELLSLVTQVRMLGTSVLHVDELYREQAVIRRRLQKLIGGVDIAKNSQLDESLTNPTTADALDEAITSLYANPNDPESLSRLESLLAEQYYRLAYWQVAVDEINYRRFFDVNDLAAIRVEEPIVFDAVHSLTFRLIEEGLVTGLRVDHPDGLLDPAAYFEQLQTTYRQLPARTASDHPDQSLYVVAEKILTGEEPLTRTWSISGTTGYDLLNQISGVLVDSDGVRRLQQAYSSITGNKETARDIGYRGKQTILEDAMASELFVLASHLFRFARSDRRSCDFTLPVLQRALREYVACFSVYRTYVKPIGWDVESADHGRIREAIRWAKIRNPTMSWKPLEFVEKVLLLEFPKGLDEELKSQWRQLSVRLQQLTAPVSAKGLEDTAFYRYFPLVSLNDVGAELGGIGNSPQSLHAKMERRAADWPHSMSSTATHDVKRGEDVRARLNVLSEMPEEYIEQFQKWDHSMAKFVEHRDICEMPDSNARYFIHQTLIGTWPTQADESAASSTEYHQRMQRYFQKAFREAKQCTSWRAPQEAYESAVEQFISEILRDTNSAPYVLIDELARKLSVPGHVNSLSQLILKSTLPGIPDFYQGNEYWSFHLVDPDNRHPVDYRARQTTLQVLKEKFADARQSLIKEFQTGWKNELKQFVTMRVLQLRQERSNVFSRGAYIPLQVYGTYAECVFAFARYWKKDLVVVVVPRLPLSLLGKHVKSCGATMAEFLGDVWSDTAIELPGVEVDLLRDQLTCRIHSGTSRHVKVSDLFGDLCFAVLRS